MTGGAHARRPITILASIALALLTLAGLDQARRLLPYSELVQNLTDLFSLPGAVLGFLLVPGGVHSGHAGRAALLAVLGNTAFYAFVWYVVVTLIRRFMGSSAGRAREGDLR